MKARVKPRQNFDPNEGPNYTYEMQDYENKIIEVELHVQRDGTRVYWGASYWWLPKWLEIIKEEESQASNYGRTDFPEEMSREERIRRVKEMEEANERKLAPFKDKFGAFFQD